MANNHTTLTGLFTDIADAIREKTGGTESIVADNFPDAISEISVGVDTSDATAVAGDIASGKTAYVDGVKVTGNITTLYSGNATTVAPTSSSISTNTDGEICVTSTMYSDKLYRSGSKHINRLDNSKFGDATAADVASGKTFTSAAGLKVAGTAGTAPTNTGIAFGSAGTKTFYKYNEGSMASWSYQDGFTNLTAGAVYLLMYNNVVIGMGVAYSSTRLYYVNCGASTSRVDATLSNIYLYKV